MTPDGVIVAAALAVVLVSVSLVAITTLLQVAAVMRVLDVLGDLLGSSRPPWTNNKAGSR